MIADVLTRALAIAGLALIVGLVDATARPVSVTREDAQATLAAKKDTKQRALAESQVDATPESPALQSSEPESDGVEATADAPSDLLADLGPDITLEQAQALFESGEVQFIDARLLPEYEDGHIPGAMWLPADQITDGEKPERFYFLVYEKPIVIYCSGGDCEASHNVAIRLELEGFTMLHVFTDGYPAWENAGLPIEHGGDPSERAVP